MEQKLKARLKRLGESPEDVVQRFMESWAACSWGGMGTALQLSCDDVGATTLGNAFGVRKLLSWAIVSNTGVASSCRVLRVEFLFDWYNPDDNEIIGDTSVSGEMFIRVIREDAPYRPSQPGSANGIWGVNPYSAMRVDHEMREIRDG